jgi:hypothetical protein
VYILYRKPLGENIYKQWELGKVIVVWLEMKNWVIGKGDMLKGGGGKGGRVSRWRYGSCWVLGPSFVFGYSCTVVVEGTCVRDYRGLRVCTVW